MTVTQGYMALKWALGPGAAALGPGSGLWGKQVGVWGKQVGVRGKQVGVWGKQMINLSARIYHLGVVVGLGACRQSQF